MPSKVTTICGIHQYMVVPITAYTAFFFRKSQNLFILCSRGLEALTMLDAM